MKIEKADCQNLDRALSLEWLETNGRGGFASGTIAGAHTRHQLCNRVFTSDKDNVFAMSHLRNTHDQNSSR